MIHSPTCGVSKFYGDIECGSRHPEAPHIRCRREFGHRSRHLAEDWNRETAPGPYGRLGINTSW